MKLFVDDIRNPPDDSWIVVRTVGEAQVLLTLWVGEVTDMSLDHDAGDFAYDGGDFIKVLDWLADPDNAPYWPTNRPTLHTMNPVGRDNMNRIIDRFGPY